MQNWISILHQGWIWSYSKPSQPIKSPPLLLLHGWTGNENSLHHLVQGIASDRWILAPRGIQQTPTIGYGWLDSKSSKMEEFNPIVQLINSHFLSLGKILGFSTQSMDILGFSQGAAVSACYCLTYPQHVQRIALLSGFIPQSEKMTSQMDLSSLSFFIAHGTDDDVVPVAEAERAVKLFRSMNAQVTFCKTKTRHKIGALCLEELFDFFNRLIETGIS